MVRKTLQWIATLVLLAGLAGGGYGYWFLNQFNERARDVILAELKKKFPEVVFTAGSAHWDWSRKIHLSAVRAFAKGSNEPLARCSEIVVALDGEELSEHQRVDLRAIRVVKPDVIAIRDAQGRWNVQKLIPVKADDAFPEIDFDDVQVDLRIERPDGSLSSLRLQQGNVRLVPSAHLQFAIEAAASFLGLADVRAQGSLDVEKMRWSITGQTSAAASIDEVIETLTKNIPEAAGWIARIEHDSLPRTASVNLTEPRPRGKFSLRGPADIQFRIRNASPHAPIDYELAISLKQAEIDHPLLPFSLSGVSGTIYSDGHQVVIRDVRATTGETEVAVNGRVNVPTPHRADKIDLTVHQLPIDSRLKPLLPEIARRVCDSLSPSGHVDLTGALVCTEEGTWKPVNWVVTHNRCSVLAKLFPYPITDIVGTAVQQRNSLVLNLEGRAGDRPVKLTGTIVNPGPDAEADYQIEVSRLPVDDKLLRAVRVHPPVPQTLIVLRLRGFLDVQAHLHISPAHPGRVDWKMAAELHDGSIDYEHFPYPITDLQGSFTFDSAHGVWAFNDLMGRHGTAELSGLGTFTKTSPDDPGELKLEVDAEHAALDHDLQQALPPDTRHLWDHIRPSGKLRTQVLLAWIPGQKPQIAIPEARVTDGSLEIQSFPYSLDHVTARLAYGYDEQSKQDRVSILSFHCNHDETIIQTLDGGQSFMLCPPADDPAGEWRLRLQILDVQSLVPDRAFRRALPPGLRQTVQALNPQGKLDVRGMLELRGNRNPDVPVTAAWKLKTVPSGATIVAGIELRNVNGTVWTWGMWDGTNVKMQGALDLRFLYAWNVPFTDIRGPFKLVNQELTVGSDRSFRHASAGERDEPIPNSERITARAVGGTFVLDAKAILNADKTAYRVRAAMANASLEDYARLVHNRAQLRGVMNGWVDLAGSSPDPRDVVGRGRLLIHPAALYELPLFIQIFKAFSLAQPTDKTAFKYADAHFTVGRRLFQFDEIDLIGDALSLRGRGQAAFDGRLKLEFYSRPPSPVTIPIISDVWNELGKNWVGVSVGGTADNPRVQSRPLPKVDDAMQNFLRSFDPRPGAVPQITPFLTAPPQPQSASAAP